MATMTLIPSTYYVSNSVLTVANESNMYTDITSTTYGTVTNTNASTSYYYFYLRGFNFDDLPPNAQVSAFTVKIRGRASGSYNSSMYLCNGTTTQSGATASQLPNSSTVTTRTFSNGSLNFSTIANWRDNFGIRINCRRNRSSTTSYYYIYGAEIEVTYTVPVSDKVYLKQNGSWVEASKVYKKISGSWVEQTDVSNIFDPDTKYKLGG